MTDRDYRAEVDERYPYDPKSEAKLLRGGFAPLDPKRLCGVRDRQIAAILMQMRERAIAREQSGEAQRERELEAQQQQDREYQALLRLADDALQGRAGQDGQALARKLLIDSDGCKHMERENLLALKKGLAALRDEQRKRGNP